MPPRIYQYEYFQRIYELEERHWWSIGMRTIIQHLLTPRFKDREGTRILDAGCGTGLMLSWLERYAKPENIVGIDISSHALGFCRRRRLTRLAQASITQLPFAGESFDLITCSDVLQHLQRDGSDARALKECWRVLKSGGIFYLRTNVYVPSLSTNGTGPPGPSTGDFHQYTRDELRMRFSEAGFDLRRITYANMLPALAATWLRRLNPARPREAARGEYRGLTMRVPPSWLNVSLKLVMYGEARYLARPGRVLPYGHSLLCLAVKPAGWPLGERGSH